MLYRGMDQQQTTREVDVYGLGYRGGAWYAAARCHLRRNLRSFRLDRVLEVQALPKSFGRPHGFDVLGYLVRSIALLPRKHAAEVLLLTDMAQARRSVFVGLGELKPGRGGVRLSIQADELAWVARELARLPFGFRVIQPAALRAELAAHGRSLLRQAARTAATPR
jgi:predicted DNA-binding transcriptional regulator YafY